MDDININTSSGSTPTINTDTSSTTTNPLSTSSQVADSIAAAIAAEANNSLSVFSKLAQPTYLNTWTSNINTSIQESKELINANTTSQILAFRGVRLSAIISAEGFIGVQAKIADIASRMQTLYTQQQSDYTNVHSSISTYNTAASNMTTQDQNQIDIMNAATDAYNSSDKGTAAKNTYNNAISAYNTYVNTTRVNTYNSAKNSLASDLTTYQTAVNSQNNSINAINIEREELGIPDIPQVDDAPSIPAQTSMPNAPSVAHPVQLANASTQGSVTSPAAPTAPPSADDLYNQYIAPVLNAALATSQVLNNFTNMLQSLNDFISYYLGPAAGKVSSLPNAFIDQTSPIFMDASIGVGSGAGASLSSMVTGLSNLSLNRILSNSIANDAAQQELLNLNQPQQNIDNIRFINVSLLTRTALYSAIPALSILSTDGSTSIDPNSTTTKAALSLGLIQQVAALSSSDDLEKAILKQLQTTNPTADPSKLAQLASVLAASSKLSLALSATSQLSQALNDPYLSNQLLGLANTPASNSALLSSNTTTIGDILKNPIDQGALRDDLTKALSQNNDKADDIIKSLNLSNITNADQLKEAVSSQLTQKGVSSDQASALASQAVDFAQSRADNANAQNHSIQSDFLNKQLQSNGINADVIARVQAETLPSSSLNQAEVGAKIQQSLINAGVDSNTAQRAASNVLNSDTSGILTSHVVSNAQYADNLTSKIYSASESSNPAQSQALGNSLVSALIDDSQPTSMTNIIRSNIAKLNSVNDQLVADNIREFIKPTYDLYDFNQRIMDPANSLLLGIWSGPMYNSSFNYKKSIDIIV